MQGIALRAVKYGLKMLKNYMSTENFKVTVDEVLDRVEDYFVQGSIQDNVIEEITKEIREYFGIEDNDEETPEQENPE